MKRAFDILLPVILAALLLAFWQWKVVHDAIPAYVLPAPSAILHALVANWSTLSVSLVSTIVITLEGFLGALVVAVVLAILFSQSRLLERALSPYAVILQVTPVVAIAPLILIWVGFEHIDVALSLIAGIIAFFPILSNAVQGLKSADFHLLDLARLYGASRWQTLWRIQMPSALPALLTGMKIGGVIALIGEVTAEFAAGSGTATGLAWRITESGNRLEIATMFAALALLGAVGIVIFLALSGLEYLLLRHWHESAMRRL
ncbi:MAG TPA: ABC transporter permease [Rhizomicrobium sp.]|jgi:NitT/TauT family transport system permease protein|nr:ABC transporter permease [Rhizomicrobium sp.]